MKPEKDISTRELVGTSTLQVGDAEPRHFDVYYMPPDLPSNPRKRELCFEHIRDQAANDLMLDFELGGMHFPTETEAQEITTQLSCKGASCILKKCGLKIEQFNSKGEVVAEMNSAQ